MNQRWVRVESLTDIRWSFFGTRVREHPWQISSPSFWRSFHPHPRLFQSPGSGSGGWWSRWDPGSSLDCRPQYPRHQCSPVSPARQIKCKWISDSWASYSGSPSCEEMLNFYWHSLSCELSFSHYLVCQAFHLNKPTKLITILFFYQDMKSFTWYYF